MTLRALIAFVAVMAISFAAADPADAAGKQKKRVTGADDYVTLAMMTASIVADFRVRALLQVEAGLDIEDRDLRERAERLRPRVQAACAEALRFYAGDQYVHGRVPDPKLIKAVLQRAVDNALGDPGAEVLLTLVLVQDVADGR